MALLMFGVGKLSARRRVIAPAVAAGLTRSGTADSDHVHTISGLNTMFMIPDIIYINQTVNDNTENYSVKDVSFTSGSNASHTFYLANKLNANTSGFHNDICVGAIQIHTASSVVFAGGPADLSDFTTSDDILFNAFASVDPTGQTYHAVNFNGTTGRWNRKAVSGSNNTGADGSISATFQSTDNPLPNAGDGIIAQDSSVQPLFTEASSSSTGSFIFLKFTVSLATNTAHKFVFAYNLGVSASDTGDDKDDQVGLYIEN